MRELVAEFPGAGLPFDLHDTVFRFTKKVEAALEEQIQRERQAGQPVGKDPVVDVAAGGEVASQRRRLLPGFAATPCILVIAVGKGLAAGKPESLRKEEEQQSCCNALRQVEAKAAKAGKPVGHHER